MMCPRCGNEGDVSKSPCSRCGLQVRLPGHSGATARPQTSLPSPQEAPFPNQAGYVSFTDRKGGIAAPNSASKSQQDMSSASRSYPFQSGPSVNSSHAESSSTSNVSRPLTSSSLPGNETSFSKTELPGQRQTWSEGTGANALSSKGVPSRPQTPSPFARSGDQSSTSSSEGMRSSIPLRPSRLVTDPLAREGTRTNGPQISQEPFQDLSSSARVDSSQLGFNASPLSGGSQPGVSISQPAQPNAATSQKDQRVLMAGTLLRSGRYRLRELRGRQEWLSGSYEAKWMAQDAQRAGSQVTICELAIPDSGPMMVQSLLRTATMALTSVGRHPHIPTLWDAFSDQGQNFFVFEPVEGETLLARMRRTGQALPEQDVIECCLQMAEILDLLAQQSPPLVHGLIRPENILVNLAGSQYILTNFSIILAGGATQFVAGLDRTAISPFMAPEFIRGVVDVRSDLYSLLATAYYAVTGSVPTSAGSGTPVPPAQRFNSRVSSEFEAILAKGLRPIANQRYQRPSELRHDLLGIRSVNGSLAQRSGSLASSQPGLPPLSPQMPPALSSSQALTNQKVPAGVAQVLPNLLSMGIEDDEAEEGLLLPRPEELPPMELRNDTMHSTFWVIGILLCLIIIVVVSRSII